MSIENETPAETVEDNLDDFSAEFFGQSEAPPEKTKPEVTEEVEDSDDAPPTDTQDTDEQEDTTDEGEETTEDKPEEAPKPKKNSAQERISELTAARREAERRADALEARLAALEKPKDETPAPTQKSDAEVAPPKPTDLNEDGTEKYPLGEFDPNFITDLADHRVEQRFAERERLEQERAAQTKQQEAMGQLEAGWNEQVGTAKERYPDYDAKLSELQPVFSDVDEHYGDYLSTTLMSMDKGADILYYLAEHPDEARAIVDSGPQKATIALGRLEARFLDSEESAPVRKVSKAPEPPPTNKGASAARGKIAPDTDDLDAFESIFFKK